MIICIHAYICNVYGESAQHNTIPALLLRIPVEVLLNGLRNSCPFYVGLTY